MQIGWGSGLPTFTPIELPSHSRNRNLESSVATLQHRGPSCSLPASPKTSSGPPVRLFSFLESEAASGRTSLPGDQGTTVGSQVRGLVKQISPFKTHLSAVPEEVEDALFDCMKHEDADDSHIDSNSLSFRSDTTTYVSLFKCSIQSSDRHD